MRKLCVALLVLAALLGLAIAASADTYNFANVYMTVEVPITPYAVQITPENIEANESYILTLGETVESMRERFTEEGILLWAYDAEKGRTLIITAVQDETSRQLYDINELTADERASYRANHTNGVFFSKADYTFESCEWKNFGENQGRFLMLKYARKLDGKVAWRGLWRRTVRNGYTITVDLRVYDRQVAAGDITALNKIQDSISFMQITSAPDAPLTLAFTAPPPESTNTDSFTIKGVTRPGAQVIVAYASLKNSLSKVFTATADGKGNFSVPVTLPAKDYYNIIVSVTVNEGMESEETVSQNYSVEYDPNKLPVTFTSPFPEAFTTDAFKLTGTTMTGVTVQLVVNDELSTKKTGNNRTFTFTIDTSKEGEYDIQLTFTKSGYDTKIFQYRIRREMDQNQHDQSIRDASIGPEYANLNRSPGTYEGRIVRYTGYVVSAVNNGSEWVITFATTKSGDNYRNLIIVLSDTEVAVDGAKVTLYGEVTGTYTALSETGKETTYPRLSLRLIDPAER